MVPRLEIKMYTNFISTKKSVLTCLSYPMLACPECFGCEAWAFFASKNVSPVLHGISSSSTVKTIVVQLKIPESSALTLGTVFGDKSFANLRGPLKTVVTATDEFRSPAQEFQEDIFRGGLKNGLPNGVKSLFKAWSNHSAMHSSVKRFGIPVENENFMEHKVEKISETKKFLSFSSPKDRKPTILNKLKRMKCLRPIEVNCFPFFHCLNVKKQVIWKRICKIWK